MYILFCMYSFCRVLSTRGINRFSALFSCTIIPLSSSVIHFLIFLPPVAEKLWCGLENFVFDWLINADRYKTAPIFLTFLFLLGSFLSLLFARCKYLGWMSEPVKFCWCLDLIKVCSPLCFSDEGKAVI